MRDGCPLNGLAKWWGVLFILPLPLTEIERGDNGNERDGEHEQIRESDDEDPGGDEATDGREIRAREHWLLNL